MPNWKKVLMSGSSAHLNQVTASGGISSSGDIIGITSANSSVLQQDLTATLGSSVGTVDNGETFTAGTSLESILRSMLIDFIPPTVDTLFIKDVSNNHLATYLEIGATDVVTKGNFTTSSASDNTTFDAGLVLTLTGNDNSLGTVTSSSLDIEFPDVTIRRSTAGNVYFRLTGTYTGGSGGTDDAIDNCGFYYPYFFGGSVNNGSGLNTSVLESILGDISGSNVASGDREFAGAPDGSTQTYLNSTNSSGFPEMTLTLPASVTSSNNYTYIIYPNSYGDLAKINQDTDTLLSTFTKLGTASHTRWSVSTTYVVYRSNLPGAFTEGTELTIDDV